MPMQIFNLAIPLNDLTGKPKPKLNTIKFDGYEQNSPQGLNHIEYEYSPKFEVDNDQFQTVLSFFESHGGYIPFRWTPPDQPEIVVLCKDWSYKQKTTYVEFKCKFERQYIPVS